MLCSRILSCIVALSPGYQDWSEMMIITGSLITWPVQNLPIKVVPIYVLFHLLDLIKKGGITGVALLSQTLPVLIPPQSGKAKWVIPMIMMSFHLMSSLIEKCRWLNQLTDLPEVHHLYGVRGISTLHWSAAQFSQCYTECSTHRRPSRAVDIWGIWVMVITALGGGFKQIIKHFSNPFLW